MGGVQGLEEGARRLLLLFINAECDAGDVLDYASILYGAVTWEGELAAAVKHAEERGWIETHDSAVRLTRAGYAEARAA